MIERPLMRLAYQHIQGEVYIVLAIAPHMKDTDREVVVISSLTDSALRFIELDRFFELSPKSGKPRFQLVVPNLTPKV